MHRNEEFLLRRAAGLTVIVPVGRAAVAFPGMICVNSTGEFLWDLMEKEQTLEGLTAALTAEYQVDSARAEADVRAFLDRLAQAGAVEGWA